ncbi:MAG: class II aldolase/adducin family protein [Gemmatimonadetes bacterium]|jgi:L-fuculose-phosphate aldolase|nr:class II aldolase/adducin family protein [Gemmatimonadota bacterium]MDE0961546.1 class II aldolase/adducin family protein [Candidatus Latescibacterota bacterium]MBT5329171.1 class II aldolase/adducin family protein [Gemmatimonadota bacterium]MBT5800062.1 class II aldolase/adducin family protein [Gemmatimonadota bacterium]MBT6618929.1 class II aldolase/adducin family protein [Gemmatimonadota bacterium]
MNSAYALRKEICEVGRRVYQRGYVAANDGNISVRMEADRVLCTPTGVSKGYLSEDMLAVCDMDGEQIAGSMKISSEIRMHLEIYKLRSDVNSVVHAHPPTATGFAVAGIELTQCVLPEVIVSLGGIPLAAYGTPGGPDIVEPMKPLLRQYDAVLMANHGVVTLGQHVMDAHFKMETVEHFAKIALVAHQLGSVGTLADKDVDDLVALRDRFGIGDRPVCERQSGAPSGDGGDLVERITEEVMRQLR